MEIDVLLQLGYFDTLLIYIDNLGVEMDAFSETP